MAGVAQLVRAPVCGTGGRRFETGHSPHFPLTPGTCWFFKVPVSQRAFWSFGRVKTECAGVAELVDALVLGTSGESRGVQVPPPAPDLAAALTI